MRLDPEAAERRIDDIVKASGTSFYWAMRFLPEHKRRAMFAIYAFCREVDDIADEPAPLPDKIAGLKRWRAEIDVLYQGRPGDPITVALKPKIEAFNLHAEDFIAVIDGMEMDAAEILSIADVEELELYCDRVACAVGRLCCGVFGLDRQTGERLSFALGQALQLTNILRDVAEDAARNRLYIPIAELRRHGIIETDPDKVVTDGNLPAVLGDLAVLAGKRFSETEDILRTCDRRLVKPAIMMKAVYGRIYDAMMARGWERFDERVGPSRPMKLLLAVRHGLF